MLEKWPFLDQNLWKNVKFLTFWTSSFYSLQTPFSALECRQRYFPGLYCLKTKVAKMAISGPKPWVNLGKNVNFSPFWTSCFYTLESRFIALECRKRFFTGLYCLKTKVGKKAIFGPKPSINPFRKMSSFRLFQGFVFIA